mmetsp:Transcript_1472/g.2235  ORF Transcript_1472/g.2235 Transcript_1472/m.2235 type:complete len:238 (-) Transcript_1472:2811-3524(-)
MGLRVRPVAATLKVLATNQTRVHIGPQQRHAAETIEIEVQHTTVDRVKERALPRSRQRGAVPRPQIRQLALHLHPNRQNHPTTSTIPHKLDTNRNSTLAPPPRLLGATLTPTVRRDVRNARDASGAGWGFPGNDRQDLRRALPPHGRPKGQARLGLGLCHSLRPVLGMDRAKLRGGASPRRRHRRPPVARDRANRQPRVARRHCRLGCGAAQARGLPHVATEEERTPRPWQLLWPAR